MNTERRQSRRLDLHWSVYLAVEGMPHPWRALTRNISRDGFYCLLEEPLPPVAQVACDIAIPTHTGRDQKESITLRCHARLIRIEKTALGYGVACRIEEYSLIRPRPDGLQKNDKS